MLNREELEEILTRDDVVEVLSSMSKEEIEEKFGDKVSRMIGFEQKNIHHCYDLFGHTLHTVEAISKDGVSEKEFKKLRVAAFFHDIGKPDVARMNEKTGQQVFYGHAQKSSQIASEMLENIGYSKEEIDNLSFYISHHDDFISYKSQIPSYLENHEFIRKITDETVAEKMIENRYNWEKMGLDKDKVEDRDKIRYICYDLARGKEPQFTSPSGIIEINVNITDVRKKIASGAYLNEYQPSQKDYHMLVNLCKADATAQTELYKKDGKVLCSRADKLENMENIDESIDRAYDKVVDVEKSIVEKYKEEKEKNDEINERILGGVDKNKKIGEDVKLAEGLFEDYKRCQNPLLK